MPKKRVAHTAENYGKSVTAAGGFLLNHKEVQIANVNLPCYAYIANTQQPRGQS